MKVTCRSFKKIEERVVVKDRLQILKEIHRKKIIERIKEEEPLPSTLDPIECMSCKKSFIPKYSKFKYCIPCRIKREPPVYHKRAKQWIIYLRNKFQEQEFTKEQVNELFGRKYSFEVIRRILQIMSFNGDIDIIQGNFKVAHKYKLKFF